MLDERCLALLNVINGECADTGYKVFSTEELALSVPSFYRMDAEGVRECVNVLSSHEYISVKYEDESEICLCPNTKGRLAFENRLDREIDQMRSERKYFVRAFSGALTGGAAASLIAFLLALLFGGKLC